MVVDMERVMSILNELFEAGLIQAIQSPEKCFDPWDWFLEHQELKERYKVHNGACKGVLVIDGVDWVIKFDYYGSDSYCKIEADNYAAAVNAGLGHYFAETRLITQIKGISFTVQERCICDEGDIYDSLYDSVKQSYIDECSECSDDDVWDEVESICEDGQVYLMFDDVELNEFVRKFHINDLHQGNFGRVNGRIVMTDFSGF